MEMTQPSVHALARAYDEPVRQLFRWKAKGYPIADPDALASCLAGQKRPGRLLLKLTDATKRRQIDNRIADL